MAVVEIKTGGIETATESENLIEQKVPQQLFEFVQSIAVEIHQNNVHPTTKKPLEFSDDTVTLISKKILSSFTQIAYKCPVDVIVASYFEDMLEQSPISANKFVIKQRNTIKGFGATLLFDTAITIIANEHKFHLLPESIVGPNRILPNPKRERKAPQRRRRQS